VLFVGPDSASQLCRMMAAFRFERVLIVTKYRTPAECSARA